MSPTDETKLYCAGQCSQTMTTNNSYECSHCFSRYCNQCLIKHHHNDVKQEFENFIKQIDYILNQFLHHAHSQTEWTEHLTNDRLRLKNSILYIETSSKQHPILSLPTYQWVYHIKSLISKNFFSINEECCKFMYPSLNYNR